MASEELETIQRISTLPIPKGMKPPVGTFIWTIVIPTVALNSLFIGLVMLIHKRPDIATSLSLVGLLSGIMITMTIDKHRHRWLGSGLIAVVVATLPFADAIAAFTLACAGTLGVTFSMVRGYAGRHNFWWPALYLPIIFAIFEQPGEAIMRFSFIGTLFVICSFVFFRSKIWPGMFAALIGFTAETLGEFKIFEDATAANLAASCIIIFAAIAIIYEVSMQTKNVSNLRLILTDGIILSLSTVGILALTFHLDDIVGRLTFCSIIIICYSTMRSIVEKMAHPARLSWAAIGIYTLIWVQMSDKVLLSTFLTIMSSAGLFAIGLSQRSRFLTRFAALSMVVLLASLYDTAQVYFWIYCPYLAVLATSLVLVILKSDDFREMPPIWKGLIRDRDMVRMRQTVRLANGFIGKIPVVGVLITFPKAFLNWLGYLRPGSSASLWDDIMVLAANLLLILITTEQLRLYASIMGWSIHDYWYARAAVWVSWGTCISCIGQLIRSIYLRTLGVLFIFIPTLLELQRWIQTRRIAPPDQLEFYGWLMLMSGLALLVVITGDRIQRISAKTA